MGCFQSMDDQETKHPSNASTKTGRRTSHTATQLGQVSDSTVEHEAARAERPRPKISTNFMSPVLQSSLPLSPPADIPSGYSSLQTDDVLAHAASPIGLHHAMAHEDPPSHMLTLVHPTSTTSCQNPLTPRNISFVSVMTSRTPITSPVAPPRSPRSELGSSGSRIVPRSRSPMWVLDQPQADVREGSWNSRHAPGLEPLRLPPVSVITSPRSTDGDQGSTDAIQESSFRGELAMAPVNGKRPPMPHRLLTAHGRTSPTFETAGSTPVAMSMSATRHIPQPRSPIGNHGSSRNMLPPRSPSLLRLPETRSPVAATGDSHPFQEGAIELAESQCRSIDLPAQFQNPQRRQASSVTFSNAALVFHSSDSEEGERDELELLTLATSAMCVPVQSEVGNYTSQKAVSRRIRRPT